MKKNNIIRIEDRGENKGKPVLNNNKKPNMRNIKNLRYSRKITTKCNDCPLRSIEEGGDGYCTKYKKDSLCVIKADIVKLIDQFETRDTNTIIPLMEAEYKNNFEKLLFFQTLEDMGNTLNPEVTKRINAMTNLGKAYEDIKRRNSTIEIEERQKLSDNEVTEISRIVRGQLQEKP